MAARSPQTDSDDRKWPKLKWVAGRKRWLLDARVGKGGQGGGRLWFETKAEAITERTKLRQKYGRDGASSIAISAELSREAMACAGRLSAKGKTLTDATNFYLTYLERESKSITWPALVKKIVAEKRDAGLAERYYKDIESRLGQFNAVAGDRLVSSIITDDISEWLSELKVTKPGHVNFGRPIDITSRNNSRRLMVLAFNFGMRGKFCSANPAKAIPVLKRARPNDDREGEDEHEVTLNDILMPIEIAALLLVAEPELIPFLAFAAFCGIRREELRRVSWRRVTWKLERIFLPKRVAKRDPHRIQLRTALEWILPYRGRDGGTLITPKNFREALDRARAKACELLESHGALTNLARWPHNCLRHGFASYHYSHYNDPQLLAAEMGHRKTDLIFTNYREPAPPELARAFWGITPSLVNLGRTGGIPAIIEALKVLEDTAPQKTNHLS